MVVMTMIIFTVVVMTVIINPYYSDYDCDKQSLYSGDYDDAIVLSIDALIYFLPECL